MINTTKTCSRCKEIKDFSCFSPSKNGKNGYNSRCKSCFKETHQQYDKKYYNNNKDLRKEYIDKNKVLIKEKRKEYNLKNKETISKYIKEYRKEYNKDKNLINKQYNEFMKKKRSINDLFKLKCNVRTLIRNGLNKKGFKKQSKTENILGCSFEEFKQHIESQFEPWMNWENMGGRSITLPNISWDIDHIIPLKIAKSEEEVIKLNHYTNLRPLCSYENRFVKKDKYE
jgi:hypothetical protein